MNNLLGNAIKFSSEQTRIVIEFYYFSETKTLRMGVIDWGIGISTEDTKVIFQPFVTLKAARDIYAAGAGLGLYICKCLCKELNGSI